MSVFEELLGPYVAATPARIEPFARVLPLNGPTGSALLMVRRVETGWVVDLQAAGIEAKALPVDARGMFRADGASTRGAWQCVGRLLVQGELLRARADVRFVGGSAVSFSGSARAK